jgi:hypothetical protein
MQIDNEHFLKLSHDLEKLKSLDQDTQASKVFSMVDSLQNHFLAIEPKAKEIQNLSDHYQKKFQALKSSLMQKNFDMAKQDLVNLAHMNDKIKNKLDSHLKKFSR